ncbi:Coatomer subunit beta' [Coemansia sp. RSA 2524]|nr:Coatomer subunit beta' [Coemansia sp. RSA 1752]KAJ1779424.1 Coatomer subunit beta' [Coemansia sp. RSA 1824]KAJ2429234.1 Coatomer subunit beta' [Coemansia sp. RSA 2524]
MGMRLDIKRKLSTRTDRVKSIDMHPTEPWVLASLYNGKAYIWNYETQAQLKAFEVSDLPVRAAKFIARKNWIITGSDDMQLRVYNYNTHERVTAFDAHQDYIRCIAVHPTLPYVLTGSDDMSIKLWDWEKNWKCIQMFEGHTYFVMGISINPKDTNTFASASLDKTIKVWSLGSPVPNYTIDGHAKGVNAIDYYRGSDKPYLVSGADDFLAKIWDYQNNSCVQTLEGHSQNVVTVAFHPTLPIIMTGSEDGTCRIWNSSTYRLESTLNYGMDRVWAIGYSQHSNTVAVGHEEGVVVLSLGRDDPAVSMDATGRIIWARHNEIRSANIKASMDSGLADGERMTLAVKDLGSCDVHPYALRHSPNGRFVAVCGDGEYIIYTALAWRNKSFGSGQEVVWAQNSNEYAVRESSTSIRMFRSFKERARPATSALGALGYAAEEIFGGSLLGVRGQGGTLTLYDWESELAVRRIDVEARAVYWSESGELFAVTTDDAFFVLRYSRDAFTEYVQQNGGQTSDEGVEDAVDFVAEIQEPVKSGCWIGDCFIYTNSANRLNYLVGGQVFTISHFDTSMSMLGYVARDNRVYLADKDVNVVSYVLPLPVIEYQTAILREDLDAARALLPSVPESQRHKIAQFLEAEGMKEMALEVTTDPEQRFDLAIQLNQLDTACALAEESGAEAKWRIVGDCALRSWNFALAERCMTKARDLSGLLLLYSASGNATGMAALAQMAEDASANNIAFTCYQSLQQNDKCLDLLLRIGRVPEAALFARSHVPARADEVAAKWKSQLIELGKNKAAEAIASPTDYANLFPDFERALTEASSRSGFLAASAYPQFKSGEVDMAVDVAVVPDGDFSTDAAVEEDTAIEIDTDAEPVLAEDVNDNVDEGDEFHEAE